MSLHGIEITREGWHLQKATVTVSALSFTESRISWEVGLWACLWESTLIVLTEMDPGWHRQRGKVSNSRHRHPLLPGCGWEGTSSLQIQLP